VTRVFRRSQTGAIALVVLVGLQVLYAAIALGLPPFQATALFAAVVVLLVGTLGGEATYWLSEAGIHREWHSLLGSLLGRGRYGMLVPWTAIRSFRHDKDLNRALTEVEFLEIDLAGRPRRLLVTDRQDPAGFARFRDAFLARAATGTQTSPDLTAPILRRPGFYASRLAHALTATFVLASVGLILLAANGGLGPGARIRLALVVVPGTAYMVWRTWIRRRP
jgi:hypothetical protein